LGAALAVGLGAAFVALALGVVFVAAFVAVLAGALVAGDFFAAGLANEAVVRVLVARVGPLPGRRR